MRSTLAPICVALALAGCTLTHPLGEGYEELNEEDKDARAVDALRDLFATRVNSAGGRIPDREVASCTSATIAYSVNGEASTLRWQDVTSVGAHTLEDVPARPETLRLYLADDSPSASATADVVRPMLAGTGLVQDYVELRSRPRWSANRLRAALRQVKRGTSVPAASTAAASDSKAAPEGAGSPGSDLDSVEAKLRRLKQWHSEGLIDEGEYEAKRQELLRGL